MGRELSGERVAIVGPATWSPLLPLMSKAFATYGIEAAIDAYGFGQDVAVLAGRDGEFLRREPRGVFVVQDARYLFKNWLRDPRKDGDPAADGRATAHLLLEAVSRMKERHGDTTWIVATLAPPYPNSGDGVGNPVRCDPFTCAVASFNKELWAAWGSSVVEVLDLGRIRAEWGTRLVFDPRMDQLARFPGSAMGMKVLAERMAAHWAATTGRMKKVLVLDCDNTLWGGIVGEDGVEGIQLGDDGPGRAFTMFQEALLALEAHGTLLTLCSRNNPEDVEEVFARRSEMVIPRHRVSATSIGWNTKISGIKTLAQKLGLGLESFVFVDDNPREREAVRQSLPMVTVPEFPQDAADLPAFGAELGWRWFQRVRLSEEDRQKTEQYRARAATGELKEQTKDPTQFLRSLDMKATIHVNEPGLVFRMAQLTQKTNQFNLTLHRYTEAEIRDMTGSPTWHLLAGSLADRFGDHGVVSLMIAEETEAAWRIDVLLLSCRVLGRGYESVFATAAFEYLRERKSLPIVAEYVRGPRNSQVADFYINMGFLAAPSLDEGSSIYQLVTDRSLRHPEDFVELKWKIVK